MTLFSIPLRTSWAVHYCSRSLPKQLPFAGCASDLLLLSSCAGVHLHPPGDSKPVELLAFDSLGIGLLLSAATAGSVELLQSVSPGHSASYLEFGAKLFLLLLGFTFGLDLRYDRRLCIGPLRITLFGPHRHQAQ